MEMTSRVDTQAKDPQTLPQTRIVRTFVEDAARLQGKALPEKRQEIVRPSIPVPTPPKATVTKNEVPPITPISVPTPAPEARPSMMVFPAKTSVVDVPSARESIAAPKQEGPAAIHTYELDFAEHVQKTGASPLSVLAAERDASTYALHKELRPSHTLRYVTFGVLLLILGAGGSYVAYQYLAPEAAVLISPRVQSLIFADEQQELTGTSAQTLLGAVEASIADPLRQGTVRILYIASTTAEGIGRAPLPGKSLIEALQLGAPDILMRNTLPESTFGIIRSGESAYPFFILRVSSYESTFRGMLDWEPRMAADLTALYPAHETEASTTNEELEADALAITTSLESPPRTFVDMTIENTDVRALQDEQGRTLVLYGYRDKSTLLITRDAAAFSELVRRLAATRQQ